MQRRLLALFLSQGGSPLSIDVIADALWDNDPPRTARKTLLIYIHRLRRLLGEDIISLGTSGYRMRILPADSQTFIELAAEVVSAQQGGDPVRAYAVAERALALWRGPAYADTRDVAMIEAEAVRLEELKLTVFEEQMQAGLDLGRHAELVGLLTTAVAENPYRERLSGQLLLALYRGGRQVEAWEVYRQTSRRLAEELGVDPTPELQRLWQQVLRADPALAAPQQKSQPTGPNLLPRDIPDFTGREQDLSWLNEVAKVPAATAVISTIAGIAGMGKTALAVHWAHRNIDLYPDGQLYLNLRGYSPGTPVSSLEALGQLLRSVGLPHDVVPQREDEAAALYRSTLAGKRMLILLDNASSVDQVRPLLPGGADNMVLITSRDRLGGLIARDGSRRLDIGGLSPGEARRLLVQILGAARVDAEPEAAAELARACGHLPLALRIAAANLADRPHQSIAEFSKSLLGSDRLGGLEVDGDPHSAVRAVFALSLRDLDAESATLFRRIGLLPVADAGAWVAQALLGVAADRALASLAEASLITTRETGDGLRYHVHDLMQLYAREQAAEPDLAALRGAYETLLWHTIAADERLTVRSFPSPQWPVRWPEPGPRPEPADPSRWFSTERTFLIRAAQDAADRGWAGLAWRILATMMNFATHERYTQEWTRAAEYVYAGLDARGEGAAALLLGLGTMQQSRGNPLPARPLLRQARLNFVQCGDTRRAATAAIHLSMVYRRLGRARLAEASVNWAISHLDSAEPVAQLGRAYLALGNLRLEIDPDPEAAVTAFGKALTVMRATGDRSGEANVLACLGQARRAQGRLAEMIVHFEHAATIMAEVNDPVGLCMIEGGLARARLTAGELELARVHAERALGWAQNSHNLQGMKEALTVLGGIALDEGNLAGALDRLQEAVSVARRMAAPASLAHSLFPLAKTHAALGDLNAARAAAQEAQTLYSSINRPEHAEIAAWLEQLS
ncbi:SARP family transcriptional regulator [Rhizocola hellebori]|uniref:SARP family transcriptional regulator n=2 Tax=Rhizocola hellebori TaxID=1392758 RepID=A0A8J3VFL4_9ACTN|nr:SARP family transcriptional regulator [Rhizocola hellebori]